MYIIKYTFNFFFFFTSLLKRLLILTFLFPQEVSEMSSAYCAQTVHKRHSTITEAAIWDVVRGEPQSPDTISVRFPISFYQQFRYLFTSVHLSQIVV